MADADKRRVDDIAEDDFLRWKHHPVTRLYRKYLTDFQKALRDLHTARWEAGPLEAEPEAEARGQLIAVGEMAELAFRHIADFYGVPHPEENSGTEAPEEDAS